MRLGLARNIGFKDKNGFRLPETVFCWEGGSLKSQMAGWFVAKLLNGVFNGILLVSKMSASI